MKMVAEKLKTSSRDDCLLVLLSVFGNKEFVVRSTIRFVSEIDSRVVMKMIGLSLNIGMIGRMVEHADMVTGRTDI